jgi:hypothetical protein
LAGHIPYEENHREVNRVLEKKCTIHDIYSPEDESSWFPCTNEYFYKTKSNKTDGLSTWCKKCSSRKAYKFNQEHPEQLKISKKKDDAKLKNKLRRRKHTQKLRSDGFYDEYYQNNPDKYKEYNKNHRQHDITKEEWRNELEVFNYKCAYCGISEQEAKKKYGQKLHKDHVDHEGYNDLRNAVPGCKICNSHKWEYDFEEWYRQQEFFSEEKLEFINWWVTEGYKDYIEDKPPYRIIKERNEDNRTYHWNLWTVDEKRNQIKIIATESKKKDLNIHIKNYLK